MSDKNERKPKKHTALTIGPVMAVGGFFAVQNAYDPQYVALMGKPSMLGPVGLMLCVAGIVIFIYGLTTLSSPGNSGPAADKQMSPQDAPRSEHTCEPE